MYPYAIMFLDDPYLLVPLSMALWDIPISSMFVGYITIVPTILSPPAEIH